MTEFVDYIFDTEIYPNFFSFCAISADKTEAVLFEVSDRKDKRFELFKFLRKLYKNKCRLVGFNNVGFDYPLLHYLLTNKDATVYELYQKAVSLIHSNDDEAKFRNIIPEHKVFIPQIDLYKIHHFDNKARATSLKMLEFNMLSDNIEDLPFPPGIRLTHRQMDIVCKYNAHDVMQTLKFYNKSLDQILFREQLSEKYDKNFMNHNDTKIGKDYFIMRLEEEIPGSCYKVVGKKRVMQQTKRKSIDIGKIIFPYVKFDRPEFNAVLDWFKSQKIKETKGVFTEIPEHRLGDVSKYAAMVVRSKKLQREPTPSELEEFKKEYPLCWVEEIQLKAKKPKKDGGGFKTAWWLRWNEAECLNVVVDGFRFDFGTGGIHGSVESRVVKDGDGYVIRDWDVASMYPNIAIANRVYPKHLSERFCDIYEDVYNQRKSYPKGSAENAMLKLALNGVYGDSNSEFSPFYDPQYTMSITINGQLSLCMLAERLKTIDGLELIQVNTDGVTAKFKEQDEAVADVICSQWEKDVGLQLEKANYTMMCIRDVNNYIAVYDNGKVKRKGAYEYEGLGWHQNHSSLVVAKAAESALIHGANIDEFINNHDNKYDFMLRTKVPRSSRLVMETENGEIAQQNICRYYISENGGYLTKIMPPLEGKDVEVKVFLTEDGEEVHARTKPEITKAERKGMQLIKTIVEPPQERRIGIETGWKVKTCNDIKDFSWDVNYDYYITQAKKLVDPILNGVDNTENRGTINSESEENDED